MLDKDPVGQTLYVKALIKADCAAKAFEHLRPLVKERQFLAENGYANVLYARLLMYQYQRADVAAKHLKPLEKDSQARGVLTSIKLLTTFAWRRVSGWVRSRTD